MNETNLRFLPINFSVEGIALPACCVDGQVFIDMRAVAKAIGLAWAELEQSLMTAEAGWQVKTISTTLLLPASKLIDWLLQPYAQAEGRRVKLTRSNLADMFAYQFPRQVLHLFPDSSDARSHAAKLARAIRTGKAITDPQVAAGIKKAFLTIRQNRKPIDRPAHVRAERSKTIKRCKDVTTDMAIEVCRHFQQTRSYRGLQDRFKLTTPALNRIISGRFESPTPELLQLHAQAFGGNAAA